jgi:hypothetical protein
MTMARTLLLVILVLGSITPHPAAAQAQFPDLELQLSKDFGYAAGSQIQGRFTLSVRGPEDLIHVQYLLDGAPLGQADAPPFAISFSTAEHTLGGHRLQAVGTTEEGEQLRSTEIQVEFVSPETGVRSALGVVGGLLLVVGALLAVGMAVTGLLGREKGRFQPGRYGSAGGAVCPQCDLPFSRHALSPNLVLGKLERCPHCSKWSVVGRASPPALQRAEHRWRQEQEAGSPQVPMDSEEGLKRMLEESRFLD